MLHWKIFGKYFVCFGLRKPEIFKETGGKNSNYLFDYIHYYTVKQVFKLFSFRFLKELDIFLLQMTHSESGNLFQLRCPTDNVWEKREILSQNANFYQTTLSFAPKKKRKSARSAKIV